VLRFSFGFMTFVLMLGAGHAFAQTAAAPQPPSHEHMHMSDDGWQFMQDAVLFGIVNRQGGPRGGTEVTAPNWWMGMTTRSLGSSRLTFNAMFSLDPATVGKRGYREIFQVGETLDDRPLVDRQHPHDFIMQLAAVWRMPLSDSVGLTIAGGPAGEPAIGPVAFMHRASAAEYPFAALSHHTFDSTHIAYGVVTAAIDRGPWVVEASLFNGREPDEHRWDFDFGRLDSVSTRVWYRAGERWQLQASTARLVEPEALEPGNVQRTTASASFLARDGGDFSAMTIGYGINATHHGRRGALFAEGTRRTGPGAIFGRAEVLQVETSVLLNDDDATEIDRKSTLGAFTVGAAHDLLQWRALDLSVGGAGTIYAVPAALRATHGSHPLSFQVFVRLRPANAAGRMWNMVMSQPMAGHEQ
jgi:hypothetical protein